jgi:hypothetical protein
MIRGPRPPSNTPPALLRSRLKQLASALTGPRVLKLRDARKWFEREYVRYVIARSADRGEAARTLGIGLSTLKEKIRAPHGAAASTRSTRVAPHAPDRSSPRR